MELGFIRRLGIPVSFKNLLKGVAYKKSQLILCGLFNYIVKLFRISCAFKRKLTVIMFCQEVVCAETCPGLDLGKCWGGLGPRLFKTGHLSQWEIKTNKNM